MLANAAAYTAVDACETDLDAATAANASGPERLARACSESGARFVHVSTDYVFDGRASAPYAEDHPTGPNTAYGRTKLDGEKRVLVANPDALIVRTSWVFGPGRNFVGAILRQAALSSSAVPARRNSGLLDRPKSTPAVLPLAVSRVGKITSRMVPGRMVERMTTT